MTRVFSLFTHLAHHEDAMTQIRHATRRICAILGLLAVCWMTAAAVLLWGCV